jgi:basic membrane protein A and related proteins
LRRVTKLAAVALSGSLSMASLAACGSTSTSSTTTKSSGSSGVKVGMAYDIGGRGDQSFNDSAARGLDKAKTTLGVEVREAEAKTGESEADKEARLTQLVSNGYNPIIAVGFVYAPAVAKVAKANPSVKFALIDSTDAKADNITNLTFAEEQGSYLVGVAAALKTKTKTVGFIGGVNTPLIKKFEAGFRAGVAATDPKVKVKITYLSTPPDFSGFADPAKGKDAAQGQLDNHADVIYSAAGSSGNGAIAAISAKKGAWGIGVDSDQYMLPALKDYQNSILTSMVKNVDTAVFDYIKSVKDGAPLDGTQIFDLKKGGVGYATSGGFVDDIKAQLDAAAQKITTGATSIPTAPAN